MNDRNPASKPAGYQAPAVHKAFELLRTVAQAPRSLGMSALSQRLGYSKSTTHGLVHALLREGALAQQSGSRKLVLGPAIADLAFSSWNTLQITRAVQPHLERMRDAIGESVFIGARMQRRVVILATAEATDPLKLSAPAGTTLPLLAGAVGKVFLALEPPQRAAALVSDLGLPAFTPRSITDEKKYLAELRRVSRQGHAVDDEEYLTGIRAVAAALNNQRGLPMAVWAVGLSSAMGNEKMERVIAVTTDAAAALRQTLDALH